MLKLDRLTKIYGKNPALECVSLEFAKGQTHVLIGSSGSGKSTLLRLIMGLIEPTTGSVTIDGQVVSARTQRGLARQIGYVTQEGGLFPHLTAEANIQLPSRAQGLNGADLDQLAQLVGLDRLLLRQFPNQLSSGQRQRVGLMRALVLDPPVLLFDEPLGALDPMIRLELQAELKRIFNQLKKTVIIVTHDLAEAAFFGHTITLLHHGKVVQKGTLAELMRHPADPFVTRFINARRPPRELEAASE